MLNDCDGLLDFLLLARAPRWNLQDLHSNFYSSRSPHHKSEPSKIEQGLRKIHNQIPTIATLMGDSVNGETGK
jgi:hypothetical protein